MSHGNVIIPTGPVVIVYKGWRGSRRKAGDDAKLSKTKYPTEEIAITAIEEPSIGTAPPSHLDQANSSRTASKKFEFVNATKPQRNRDPEVRKLVRTHVMKEFGKTRRQHKRNAQEKDRKVSESPSSTASPKSLGSKDETSPIPSQVVQLCRQSSIPRLPITGASTCFTGTFPIDITPEFNKLLNYYLTAIAHTLYPFEEYLLFNPIRKSWWRYALHDDVLFYTVMVASATHMGLRNGNPETNEANLIMKSALEKLGRRLREEKLSDATIGAVSCLAITESLRGDHHKFLTHMAGMAKMVKMRGGLASIDEGLQLKIYRTDLEGAVDGLTIPHLPPITRTQPPIAASIPPCEYPEEDDDGSFVSILRTCDFSSDLISILQQMVSFSRAINYALENKDARVPVRFHPDAFDEDTIFIQRALLFVPEDRQEKNLERATRMGAMIYTRTLTRNLPASANASPKALVRGIKESLNDIAEDSRIAPLILWLLFMGGIASVGLPERAWFVAHLVKITVAVRHVPTWECVKAILRRVLWVEKIHSASCKRLWAEVETTSSIFWNT